MKTNAKLCVIGFINIIIDFLMIGFVLFSHIMPLYSIPQFFLIIIIISLLLNAFLSFHFSSDRLNFLKIPTNWIFILLLIILILMCTEPFSLNFSDFG